MRKPLLIANLALLGAIGLHGADHLAQERGIDAVATEVIAGGQVVLLVALVSLALVWRGHPRSRIFALVTGLAIAVGVVSSHFAPRWSAFSDPYAELDLPLISWAAAGIEVLAALVLAAVAARSRQASPV